MTANTATDVLDRFLRYVQVNTQSSDAQCDRTPSTKDQFNLANMLAKELREMGVTDVYVDEHAYVLAKLPASASSEGAPALGLIAHMDTSEAAPGAGVKPHIVHYDGGDLVAGIVDGRPVAIGPSLHPELLELEGEDLVCSDGTTLLGSDDKAGVAEIMALVARLMENEGLPHPALGICFCPDEEIGHGAALLDVDRFGCAYAYTVDGGHIGEIEWECFNAADATITVNGYSIHPGDAKGRMINALNLLHEFHGALPENERPENTEGYEGFFHLMSISGTVTHATARYIIRDHDAEKFQTKMDLMRAEAEKINGRYAHNQVNVEIKQQYRNMAEIVANYPQLISNAQDAFEACDVEPITLPIRGGTDGAQLSFRGLPCPNLSTGGYCFHGVNEFIPVSSLERMVDVLQDLVSRFA